MGSSSRKKEEDDREGMDTFWSGPNMGGNPRFFKPGHYSMIIAGVIEGGFQRVIVHDNDNGEEHILFRAVTEKAVRMDTRHKALTQTARTYLDHHEDVRAIVYLGPFLTTDAEQVVYFLETSPASNLNVDTVQTEMNIFGERNYAALDIVPELQCVGIIHAEGDVDYSKELQDFSYGIVRVTRDAVEDIQPGI